MNTNHIGSLASRFGHTGFPTGLDENLKPSWDAYVDTAPQRGASPRDRVLNVLGFLHLMNQAGYRPPVNPYKAYDAVLREELGGYSEVLATQLRKSRIFDLFKIYKTHFEVDSGLRGTREISLSFCVVPKRNESLDSVLQKAEGFLYQKELPIYLQEKWRKMSIKSKATRPKSSLPRYVDLLRSPSLVNRLPLYISSNCSLHVSRASGGMLVFRFRVTQPTEQVSWMTKTSHKNLIRRAWIDSFKNLRG